MKGSVCIVGAGPAGLVAAKTFLQTGNFEVTVYEKKDRLGGIWAIQEDTKDGYLSFQTPTNLSRFTVAFSDLDWRSVDLGSRQHEGKLPIFPKAWQVNRYLQTYQQKFVPRSVLNFSSEVVEAERADPPALSGTPLWRVTVRRGSKTDFRSFDFLIVGSGFFSGPRPMAQVVPGWTDRSARKTIHSSQFRTLTDVFPTGGPRCGNRVLLIGGGNSGGEAAAAVAMQLSDARWSPESDDSYEDCKVVHVVPRPLYALPPFVEYDPGSRTYVPIDFKLYDYSRRPAGAIQSYAGKQPSEVRTIVHRFLQAVVGGNQSDLDSEALSAPSGQVQGSAYVALSETYPEFVRSGLIEVVAGRVTSLVESDDGTLQATVSHNDSAVSVDDIGAVVYATGYTPSAALDFLANDVKAALQYDARSMRMPLILEQWQTMSNEMPSIGFVGFYEGPYWGIMEMQSRVICERWSGRGPAPQRPFEERDMLLQLRDAMQTKSQDVPQYWFGDYLGYMEDMAGYLNLRRNDQGFTEREGCPSTARFATADGDHSINNNIVQDLQTAWRESLDGGRHVARATFRALQGKWNINRRIINENSSFSGTLEGQASFHPRFPLADSTGKTFDSEHLYIESGTFTSSNGQKMQASRRYVYRYNEAEDQLSVWFVKPDADLETDYLFHNLDFVPPAQSRLQGACVAKADHLCVEAMYWTKYTLPLRGIWLPRFEIEHKVKGPDKEYIMTTQYVRPATGGP
ncbi:hypothetical protein B0A50_01076 [Salinomyces thailandicus]|uniref:DUF6314 domain-containing protein n=1 Tax=Salinomyces thailandicus TaxID=706561 RepID=A0A4U0UBN1_9PEZI|nr:hypothetical protein B0A50_01076 [Salinomyces thailandica]